MLAAFLGGCAPETKYKILSTFFDGVPRPGEEAKKKESPRRRAGALATAPEKPVAEVAQSQPIPQEVLSGEKVASWQEAGKLLPRDAWGSIDWVKAIKEGKIKPRPGLEAGAPDQPALPLDFELSASGNLIFLAFFPHSSHTQWLGCPNCHPGIFAMAKGTAKVTMAQIMAGKYCGMCHGPSRIAFPADTACARCHIKMAPPSVPAPAAPAAAAPSRERPEVEKIYQLAKVMEMLPKDAAGGIDWVKALREGKMLPRASLDPLGPDQPILNLNVEREPPGNLAFKAVFSHEVHTAWLSCTNCHTEIFQMKRGATSINMGLIMAGKTCGRCHGPGKVAFPAETGCARCHPAMAGG